MQVGVALPVRVAAEVHRQAVDEERDVGPVIGVEAAQEILLGLAAPLMLADEEPGHDPQDIGGTALRAQLEVSPRDEQLGRGGDRRGSGHGDRLQHGQWRR